jgi:hypothetical protein
VIRRLIQLALVLATFAGAWLLRPVPTEAGLDLGPEPAPPAFVGCVGLAERDLSSLIAIGSVVRGDVVTTLAAPGDVARSVVSIDAAGGASLSMDDIGAAGVVGALVEMTTADAAAAVVVGQDSVAAAASCTPASTGTLVVLGGSTNTGETLELVLTNPYAADAVVSVTSSSEVGEDSATEIASLLVPARSTVVRPLQTLLTLRQSLSVRMEVQRGAIHAALVQVGSGDLAVFEGVEPAQDWWLPSLVAAESSNRLVVVNTSPVAVDVVIDTYQNGTVVEAAFSSVIEARSQLDLPVGDLAEGPVGLRVSSDGPVVAGLVVDGEATRSLTPGTTLSTEWVIAGSSSTGDPRVWVLNPGEVEAELVLQPLLPGAPAQATTVPADAVAAVPIEPGGAGYLIRSTSEIAVFWSTRQVGLALATGHPLAGVVE